MISTASSSVSSFALTVNSTGFFFAPSLALGDALAEALSEGVDEALADVDVGPSFAFGARAGTDRSSGLGPVVGLGLGEALSVVFGDALGGHVPPLRQHRLRR